MKKTLITISEYIGLFLIITLAVGVGTGNLNLNTAKDSFESTFSLGSTFNDDAEITLIGSSTNYVSLPKSAVFAVSTTTDAGGSVADGGYTLQQEIDTSRVRKGILYVNAKGETATSTVYVRQMGSFDGTNYYDIATTTAMITSTSTPISLTPLGVNFDPGTSSTTIGIAIPFTIDGYQKTRFVIYGEDVATDPNDGVQAWITATLIRDTAN